ncbi:hypothetical protein L9F63_005446, partial [Diploptera punctata]
EIAAILISFERHNEWQSKEVKIRYRREEEIVVHPFKVLPRIAEAKVKPELLPSSRAKPPKPT